MVVKAKPKTIYYNRHGLVVAVLKEFRPNFKIQTKLPRKEQKDIYIPSEKEVKALFEHIDNDKVFAKGTQTYLEHFDKS